MKYFINTKKDSGMARLFFVVNRRNPKFKSQFNTHVQVDIQAWTKAQSSTRELQRYQSTKEGARVYDILHLIESAVNDAFSSGKIHSIADKDIIIRAIDSISFADSRRKEAEEKARKEAEEQRARAERMAQYEDICRFYDYYLDKMKRGVITTNGNPYRKSTIDCWVAFGIHLKAFMKERGERTFSEVSPSFRDEFVYYLSGRGLMKGAISLYVSKFRALCKAAAEDGYNNNAVSLQGWKARNPDKDEKKAEIYLTEEELKALYEMPLVGIQSDVRDLFIIGASIAQRYSDYSRIDKSWKLEYNGRPFLHFKQIKTGKEMIIPILDARAKALLEKHGYNSPFTKKVGTFNIYLRDILKELSSTIPSLKTIYQTSPTKADERTTKAKWELVSSHTARRSGVTNMYKANILDKREMMSITGHSTEKIFEGYVKLGPMEQAKRIADKLDSISPMEDKAKEIS